VRKRLISYTIETGSFAVGKKLHDLHLTSKGITLHKNRKDDSKVVPPNSDEILKAGDVLVLFGTPEDIEHVEGFLMNG